MFRFKRNRGAAAKDTTLVDERGVVYSGLDEHGQEVLDDTPLEIPAEFLRPPSMYEQMRAMVRSELLARYAAANEMETFEESEDFDVGEDFDPASPWENDFDPDIEEVKEEVKRARKPKAPAEDPPPPPHPEQNPDE